MVYTCAIRGCNNNSKKVQLHSFPKDKQLFNIWIRRVGRKDLQMKTQEAVNKSYRICNIHFGPEAAFIGTRYKSTIKKEAVPTLFLPPPIEDIDAAPIQLLQDNKDINLAISDTVPPVACEVYVGADDDFGSIPSQIDLKSEMPHEEIPTPPLDHCVCPYIDADTMDEKWSIENNKDFPKSMNNEIFDFEAVKNDLLKSCEGEITIDRTYWQQGIAVIWLNHVEKRNSVTGKMMVDLMNCIEELEGWMDGKAVIIAGRGVNFCSGGDLDFVKLNAHPNNASNMSHWMITTLKRLANLEMVTVCIAHGPTLGGGAEISTFCDYLLVADDVKYGFIQGNLGIITAWGGGTRLIQKIGERAALSLLLTSKILTAEDCVRIGLAEKVISSKCILEDTMLWLEDYIKHTHQVIRSYKRLAITSRGDQDIACTSTFDVEREMTRNLWGGIEHIKQINKFKRKAVDTNK